MKYKILQIGINSSVTEIASFNDIKLVKIFLKGFLECRNFDDLLIEITGENEIINAEDFLNDIDDP